MVMRSTLLLLTAASVLPAQRLPTDDGARIVQLFDLRKLRTTMPAEPAGPVLVLRGEEAQSPDVGPAAIAALLGALVEPALGKGDALQPLGEHFLVLLGSAEQAASLDRMFAAAAARRGNGIEVEIRFLKLTEAAFDKVAKPRLKPVGDETAGRYQQVLRQVDAAPVVAAIVEAAGEQLDAPRLLVWPLDRASVAFKKQISYIKDFTLTAKDGSFLADPVVDVVWDGNETIVTAALLQGGMIGLSCDATFQEVRQPMQNFETTLVAGTPPVTIQLPQTTTVRLRQTSVVGSGDAVMLASRKPDGTFLVAIVTATEKKL